MSKYGGKSATAEQVAALVRDGMWLDYHHSHASWERAEPLLPDTCFCNRCIAQFKSQTGTPLPDAPVAELSRLLLSRSYSRSR